jgi:hypothetical protein
MVMILPCRYKVNALISLSFWQKKRYARLRGKRAYLLLWIALLEAGIPTI